MEMISMATRKGAPPIKVYCLPEEKDRIKSKADQVGLSMSNYLLSLGMGFEVRGIVDCQKVDELAAINADLGRLGGLLKMWLTNDQRLARFADPQHTRRVIEAVLVKIDANQSTARNIMKEIIHDR